MPTITLHSNFYGTFPFAEGIPTLSMDTPYPITDEQKESILRQYATFPDRVKSRLRLQFSDGIVEPAIAAAVQTPLTPTALEIDLDEPPIVEDLTSLSDEDLDLINVEVSKLIGKPVADTQPILVATGGDPEQPKLLRSTYLKEVIAHPEIKKTLKDVAAKMLEQI
jgi:hypothetical protein